VQHDHRLVVAELRVALQQLGAVGRVRFELVDLGCPDELVAVAVVTRAPLLGTLCPVQTVT
jgi:hypothetical protein